MCCVVLCVRGVGYPASVDFIHVGVVKRPAVRVWMRLREGAHPADQKIPGGLVEWYIYTST